MAERTRAPGTTVGTLVLVPSGSRGLAHPVRPDPVCRVRPVCRPSRPDCLGLVPLGMTVHMRDVRAAVVPIARQVVGHVAAQSIRVCYRLTQHDHTGGLLDDGQLGGRLAWRRCAIVRLVAIAESVASAGAGPVVPVSAPGVVEVRAGTDEELAVLDVGSDGLVPGPGIPGLDDPLHSEHLVVVTDVHQGAEGELLEVAQAGGLARLFARLGEDGEQDRRQDGDDRDDDQQLDQGEALALHVALSFTYLVKKRLSDRNRPSFRLTNSV